MYEIIDELSEFTEKDWDRLRDWAEKEQEKTMLRNEAFKAKEQRDREVESMKEFEGRLRHARNTASEVLEDLLRISEERWTEPVAIVREEREIQALRDQLRGEQS